MLLIECDGKALLREFGIDVPSGATTADDATSGGAPINGFPGAGAGGGRISSTVSSRQRGANGVGFGSGGGGGAGSQTDYGLGSGRGGNGGPAYARVVWAF